MTEMYLEIAFDDEMIAEIPLQALGPATALQAVLEGLFEEWDEQYDLSGRYDCVEEWVTDLEIAALYRDTEVNLSQFI